MALVRFECRSAALLTLVLAGIACVTLVALIVLVPFALESLSSSHRYAVSLVALLLALPILAQAFATGAGRDGSTSIRMAPVRGASVALAKCAAVALLTAVLWLSVGLATGLALGLVPPPDADAFVLDIARTDDDLLIQIRRAAMGAYLGTAFTAICTRHALAAMIAGPLLGGLPCLLHDVWSQPQTLLEGVRFAWLDLALAGADRSAAPALIVLAAVGAFRLRGPAARVALRRGVLGGAILVGLTNAGPLERLGLSALPVATGFEDPGARVFACLGPLDGEVVCCLTHSAPEGERRTIWRVNTSTGVASALASPVALVPLGRAFGEIHRLQLSRSGEALVGDLAVRPHHWGSSFRVDLASGRIDAPKSTGVVSQMCHGPWTSKRVHVPPSSGLWHTRMEHPAHGSYVIECTTTVWASGEAQRWIDYVDNDQRVHRLDARTGEDRVLSLDLPEGPVKLQPSPDGRWIVGRVPGEWSVLYEPATGRSRRFEGYVRAFTQREHPLLLRGNSGPTNRDWRLVGLDGELEFQTAVRCHQLIDLDGEQWLAVTNELHVLDSSGAVARTLRSTE